MNRLLKIAKEAAEQSGRGDIPDIIEPIYFKEVLSFKGNKVVLRPEREKNSNIPQTDIIFISPERGWTEEELSFAEKRS